jgi:CheY-like chemotaxis protein
VWNIGSLLIQHDLHRAFAARRLNFDHQRPVMSHAEEVLRLDQAAVAALVGAMLLALGWLASLRVRRGIRRLMAASSRIAHAEFATPIPTEHGAIAELARSLASRAQSLADRDHQADALLAVGRVSASGSLDGVLAAGTPDLAGVDIVSALRGDELTQALPIILVTANQLSSTDRARLNGSVAAILAKADVGATQLLAEIRRVVGESA